MRYTYLDLSNKGQNFGRLDAVTIGLNWYLNANVKLVANYARTSFDAFGNAAPRKDEEILFTRAQLSF